MELGLWSLLGWRSASEVPLNCQRVLILDEVASPGSFLLFPFVQAYVSASRPVVIVSTERLPCQYLTVLRKQVRKVVRSWLCLWMCLLFV